MSSTSISSLAGIFRNVNSGPTKLSLPVFTSGATPCMKTLRKPRRNGCVVNVAVLTRLRRFIAPSLNGFAITLLGIYFLSSGFQGRLYSGLFFAVALPENQNHNPYRLASHEAGSVRHNR